MANEKERTEMNQSAAEEDLEQISGGKYKPAGAFDKVVCRDSRGNPTHWQAVRGANCGKIYHYICPHCKGLLHKGAFERLYCDPCDESWFAISLSREIRFGYY